MPDPNGTFAPDNTNWRTEQERRICGHMEDIQQQAQQAREGALEGLYAVRMAATGT